MEFKICFKVSRTSDDMESSGEGELREDNFAEMVEEIKRWLDVGGKIEVLGVEEV